MKFLAFLLISLSLVAGLVGAMTAYAPRLDRVDPSMGLALNAPAGRDPDTGRPIAQPGPAGAPPTILDESLVAALRANVDADDRPLAKRVAVREFRFDLWDGKWLVLVAAFGLGAGAWLVRAAQREALRAIAAGTRAKAGPSPALALRTAALETAQIREIVLRQTDDAERLQTILRRIEALQRTQLEFFLDGIEELRGLMGPAEHARLMDRFAAAERVLNRAWSAAADDALDEALACVLQAVPRMEDAVALLPGEIVPAGAGSARS